MTWNYTNPEDLIEAAWGLIANANGGDWSSATDEWREAAEQWRDGFHDWLDAAVSKEAAGLDEIEPEASSSHA